jgi:PleD family two-component response regulator
MIVTNRSRNVSRVSSSGVSSREDKDRYWKRILIVDDDPYITTTFKVGIENANKRITVHTYNVPRKALLDFQPNLYDLLLIDINMPHMNGFQFFQPSFQFFLCLWLYAMNLACFLEVLFVYEEID